MKRRITGRVNRGRSMYELVSPAGDVVKEITLDQAREDRKLQAAIARNGWETIDA